MQAKKASRGYINIEKTKTAFNTYPNIITNSFPFTAQAFEISVVYSDCGIAYLIIYIPMELLKERK